MMEGREADVDGNEEGTEPQALLIPVEAAHVDYHHWQPRLSPNRTNPGLVTSRSDDTSVDRLHASLTESFDNATKNQLRPAVRPSTHKRESSKCCFD